MICPSCKQETPDNARFCDNCGAPLVRACASCGAGLRDRLRYCVSCGAALQRPAGAPATVAFSASSPPLPAPAETESASVVAAAEPEMGPAASDATTIVAELEPPSAAAEPPLSRAPEFDFVGREPEMEELRAALDATLAGTGALVLVSGAAGAGTSRLAWEFAEDARARDVVVITGRCAPYAAPYAAWNAIMRAYAQQQGTAALGAAIGPGAETLAEVLPDARRLLPELPPPPPAEPGPARLRLFDAMAAFLTHAGERTPLLLVLDDLQHADPASLRLLGFVATVLPHTRVLIVATYGQWATPGQHDPARARAALGAAALHRHLRLRGLSEGPAAQLLEQAAGRPLSGDVVRAAHQATDGRPLALIEIGRLWAAGGDPLSGESGGGGLPLPWDVADIMALRLSRLSEVCRSMLAAAAVIDAPFSAEVVAPLCGEASSGRLSDPNQVRALCEEAAAAGVLHAQPAGSGQYAFSHRLMRDTVYGGLSSVARVRLHRWAGEALEQSASTADEPDLTRLAHHFFEAAPGGDTRKALDYERFAADRDAGVLAFEDAAAHLARALDLIDAIDPVDESQRCDLLIALAEQQHRIGDPAAAKATVRWAVELAWRLDAPEQLARAALTYHDAAGDAAIGDTYLASALQQAVAALGSQESPLRVRLLDALARVEEGAPPLPEPPRPRRGADTVVWHRRETP